MPDTKAYCLMAPTAIEFYAPSKYNTGVSKSQYEGMCYIYEQLKDITPVNAYAEMAAHTDEYLYFRSDHHWITPRRVLRLSDLRQSRRVHAR